MLNFDPNLKIPLLAGQKPPELCSKYIFIQNYSNIWWHFYEKHERLVRQVGGERNRKQRIPVNSITSKLVLKSIYASGSTGPFFADHYLNRLNRLNSSFAKKTDFLLKYLVLSEIRYARKRNWSKQERNLLSKVFNLFEIFEITEQEFLLDCLFSARIFIYCKYLFEKGKTKIFLSRHILSLTPYPRPV